jgi:hypothetical protein
MRRAVAKLAKMGTLPSEEAPVAVIQVYEDLLLSITQPVTDGEAKLLITLFGSDEAYGLAWYLLHLIESAPSWPIEECLQDESNEWIRRLKKGIENSRRLAEDQDKT